ncbi:hypothetical protein HK102_006588, partial [Quaeritorhiza haematococci]
MLQAFHAYSPLSHDTANTSTASALLSRKFLQRIILVSFAILAFVSFFFWGTFLASNSNGSGGEDELGRYGSGFEKNVISMLKACVDRPGKIWSPSGNGGEGRGEEKFEIPPIIHQSWKTHELPLKFRAWSNTWKENHPHWEYRLWTDNDNRRLVEEHYPWFLPTFESFPHNIMRVDSVRVLYLHKYGGVYADLDVESTGSLDQAFLSDGSWMSKHQVKPPHPRPEGESHPSFPSFSWDTSSASSTSAWGEGPKNPLSPSTFQKDQGVVLASLGPESLVHTWIHSVPNAWMASRPGHSFWMHCIKFMMKQMDHIREHNIPADKVDAEYITGPGMLHRVYLDYMKDVKYAPDRDPVYMLAPDVIFPYSWDHNRTFTWACSSQSPNFSAETCKKEFVKPGSTFGISYWSHSWGNDGNSLLNEEKGLGS